MRQVNISLISLMLSQCREFRMSFGTEDLTLNTADVAILLVSRPLGGGCGQAYANGYQHGTNFGWVAKNCHVRQRAQMHK